MEQVLEQAQLLVATHERRLEALRPAHAADLGHDAQRPPHRHGRGLALEQLLPGRLVGDRAGVASRVVSPTSTVPGGATLWRRDAVLTRSPATIPWSTAPRVTAASPVSTPARAWSRLPPGAASVRTTSTRSSAARTARSASSSWAIGAPHTAITASPMNFSTVPP